jgi:hypothetical protein
MNYTDAFDRQHNAEGLSAFDATQPAPSYDPLPPGAYNARVLKGEVIQTKTGNDGYRLTFVISDGPHAGRTVAKTFVFTPKSLPYSKRDLAAFGLTTARQLLSPFPEPGKEYIVRLVVALQRSNDGTEFNDIKRCDVLRVAESPIAPFLVPPQSEEGMP